MGGIAGAAGACGDGGADDFAGGSLAQAANSESNAAPAETRRRDVHRI